MKEYDELRDRRTPSSVGVQLSTIVVKTDDRRPAVDRQDSAAAYSANEEMAGPNNKRSSKDETKGGERVGWVPPLRLGLTS